LSKLTTEETLQIVQLFHGRAACLALLLSLKFDTRLVMVATGLAKLQTIHSIDISTGLVPGKLLIVQVKAVGPAPDRKESKYNDAETSREIPVGGTSDDTSDLAQITLPPDPEDVIIEAIGVDQVALRWGATASGQKLESFVAVIKHSSKTDGSGSWANSSMCFARLRHEQHRLCCLC
jgi:hypothetical protein